jgi:hypothetical protein
VRAQLHARLRAWNHAPPGGVRFVGGLLKLNAILTALGAVVLIAKSGDDAFFELLGVDPESAGYRGCCRC